MIRNLFALCLVFAAFACSKSDAPSGDSSLPGAPKGSATPTQGDVTLTGAGATFPYPLYTKWIAEFAKTKPNTRINYQSIGSGGGIRQVTERTVDFGASDAPMSDEQIEKAKGIVHIPTCLGAVVVVYNLEGVSSGLSLSPEVLSNIFLGKIKDWNDPRIQADNATAKLPAKPISTVHRSDGSGTTKIFADYLTAVSTDWKGGPGSGTSVSWPNGLGAKGNEGVSALVQTTPNSIGYVELAYAAQTKLSFASIKNKAGKFVAPSLETITAAAASVADRMPADMRVSIVNVDGDTAYPISGFTYILLYAEQQDAKKGKVLVDFLKWALTDGQKMTDALHYAPLPAAVVSMAQKALSNVKGSGGAAL